MTRWHSDALAAPHTQRELDEIPQREKTGPDAAKIALMEELNWKPASQYWREKAEAANQRIEELERELEEACEAYKSQADFSDQLEKQLAAEKALADDLAEVARSYFDREEVNIRNAKLCFAIEAYRTARGL